MMLPLGLAYLPWAIWSREGAIAACKAWCRWTLWTARLICGIRHEVRGPVPDGQVLIAAKHQSFLDIIILYHALPRAKFIMKRELQFFPIIGQFALRIGCIPVARGKRAEAIRAMVRDVEAGRADAGQLIIYPQGTRVAPGAPAPYKIGTGALYEASGQTCIPVACNVGVMWPRSGPPVSGGAAVVEFLPPIPPGLPPREFMVALEAAIEPRSSRLMAEAGFPLRPVD
ncbi:MAG: lysophospholipid acyltransferase family protein [Paracoccaceae bacterium]